VCACASGGVISLFPRLLTVCTAAITTLQRATGCADCSLLTSLGSGRHSFTHTCTVATHPHFLANLFSFFSLLSSLLSFMRVSRLRLRAWSIYDQLTHYQHTNKSGSCNRDCVARRVSGPECSSIFLLCASGRYYTGAYDRLLFHLGSASSLCRLLTNPHFSLSFDCFLATVHFVHTHAHR